MRNIKRLFSFILVMLLTIALVFVGNVKADEVVDENTITDNKGNSVKIVGKEQTPTSIYAVKETVEERELEFGLLYRFDKGYVNTTDAGQITADMNAAGGGAYASSGKMKDNTYYPTDVRLFEIDPSLGLSVVPWAKFKNGNWSLNSVLAMAEDYEASHPGYKVVGAINGDFFDINSTENYNLCSTGGTSSYGNNYKVNPSWQHMGFKDGTLVGAIYPTISEKPVLEILDKDGNPTYKVTIDHINEDAGDNETTVYMAFWNADHDAMSFDVEDAYIINASVLVPFSTSSIYGIGELTGKGKVTLTKTNYAIKTNNSELASKLVNGATVRVQHEYTGALEDYDFVCGYPHTLLQNGEDVTYGDYRHPRTIIGKKADGTIVMAEVDGRQANKDCYGATLREEAVLMKYYGCIEAYNLDGGGSSTICIIEDGELTIKNSPSDGRARSDGNCLLIVAEVPVMEVTGDNVKDDSFDIKVDITKGLDKYNDLYVKCSVDDELRKVENGKPVSYTNLPNNTKYSYQLYAKLNDKYVKMPFSGTLFSAKKDFVFSNFKISMDPESDDNYYSITFDFSDEDEAILTSALVVNGKRYYAKNGKFVLPMECASPLSSAADLTITYNMNDLKGRLIKTIVMNPKVEKSDVLFDGVLGEVLYSINSLTN